ATRAQVTRPGVGLGLSPGPACFAPEFTLIGSATFDEGQVACPANRDVVNEPASDVDGVHAAFVVEIEAGSVAAERPLTGIQLERCMGGWRGRMERLCTVCKRI